MAVESRSIPWRRRARRLGALGVLFALCAGMSGCGLAAAPCRVASAGLKIVPLVGHVAAAPTDACADAIDPWAGRGRRAALRRSVRGRNTNLAWSA